MSERSYEGPRTEAVPVGVTARSRPNAAILNLQRRVGNRAVQRLLQRDSDDFAPVKDVSTGKWGAWQKRPEKVLDPDLFLDLVVLAGADKVKSVADTWGAVSPINGLDEAKPGLNYFAKLDAPATTGFIDASGHFGPKLPVSSSAAPRVAIVLGPKAFARDRAYALAVLRHEMRHAMHFERSIEQMQTWQKRGGGKGFTTWAGSQKMTTVERALLTEELAGTKANTETLAWIEGAITGLPFLSAAPSVAATMPDYPTAIEELLGAGQYYVAQTTEADVHKAALAHLQSYCCGELDAAQRERLRAWVSFLIERAGGPPPTHGTVSDTDRAAQRVYSDFSPLLTFLRDLQASLRTPCPKVASSARDLVDQLAKGKSVGAPLHGLADAELRELDTAAAGVAKGTNLRKEISNELFARHKPTAASNQSPFTVANPGKLEKKESVSGGTVEIRTAVDVSAPGAGSSKDAFSLQYTPTAAMAGEQWLQLTWREFYTDLGGGKKHRRPGLLEWSGFAYQFTTDPNDPHWNTDSGSKRDAFNEDIRNRSGSSLTMFDFPSSNISELTPLFSVAGEKPRHGVSHFHQDMFLVRGAEIIYHAAIDQEWTVTSATDTPKLTSTVHPGLPNRLASDQRDRLTSQYPTVDYLRDF
jgi:hypothetical protein